MLAPAPWVGTPVRTVPFLGVGVAGVALRSQRSLRRHRLHLRDGHGLPRRQEHRGEGLLRRRVRERPYLRRRREPRNQHLRASEAVGHGDQLARVDRVLARARENARKGSVLRGISDALAVIGEDFDDTAFTYYSPTRP